jgi:hypothetical protein
LCFLNMATGPGHHILLPSSDMDGSEARMAARG